MQNKNSQHVKIGVAGLGAIGSAVAKALNTGIDGMHLQAYSDPNPSIATDKTNLSFHELIQDCDLIIECLPAAIAAQLAHLCLDAEKDMIMISACALLIDENLHEKAKNANSKIYIPSGALAGVDGVTALKHIGIKSASIASIKKPQGFKNAPFILENDIDLSTITEATKLFSGNAKQAAKGFPENVNVAATLSLAGLGPLNTQVEIWADPNIKGNCHELTVEGEFSAIKSKIENTPDPSNPKSSMLAAQSIVALLHNMRDPLVIL